MAATTGVTRSLNSRRLVTTRAGESRIGKQPVMIPQGVDVKLNGQTLTAKGPKGELSRTFHQLVELEMGDGVLNVKKRAETRQAKELHGLSRALANNLVVGVHEGFDVNLQLIGVGYRAKMNGSKGLTLSLGFSHDVEMEFPEGVTAELDKQGVNIKLSSANKETVTQFAADIRKYRPPEPYKGKGVHYLGEQILRKEGKKGK